MSEIISTTMASSDTEGEEAAFAPYRRSGAHAPAGLGLRLISLPTARAQRLGVERLRESREAGDRLASCVLGMCALRGACGTPSKIAVIWGRL